MLNNTENTLFCFEETSLLKAVQHNYPNISCLSYSEFIQSLNPFKSFSTEETEAELKNILDEKSLDLKNYYLKTFEFIQASKSITEEAVGHFFSLLDNNDKNRLLKKLYLKYLESPLSKNFTEKAIELIEKIEPSPEPNGQTLYLIKGKIPTSLFFELSQKLATSNVFNAVHYKDIWEIAPLNTTSYQIQANAELLLKKIGDYLRRHEKATLFFEGSREEKLYLDFYLKNKKIKENVFFAPLLGFKTSMPSLSYIGNCFEDSALKDISLTSLELDKLKTNGIEVFTHSNESIRKQDLLHFLPKILSPLELKKRIFSLKPKPIKPLPQEDFSKISIPLKHLSASQLELYQKCPTQYLFNKLKYSLHNIDSIDYFSLLLGKTTHNTFEKFIQTNQKDFSVLPTLFKETLLEAAPTLSEKPSLLISYEERFKSFIPAFTYLETQLKEVFGNFTTKGLEVPFEIEVDSIRLKGIIDRVILTEDNQVLLLDYKTGEVNFTPNHIMRGQHFQSLIYLLASEQIFKEPCLGFLFYDLKKSELRKGILFEERITPQQKKYVTRGHSQTPEGWNEIKLIGIQQIKNIYSKIKNSEFSPIPNFSNCLNCSFKGLCRSAYGSE
jgi:hypothetical protein